MKIFLYDTETTESLTNYESEFVPSVGDIFTSDDLGTKFGGTVAERIIHTKNPTLITIRVKLNKF